MNPTKLIEAIPYTLAALMVITLIASAGAAASRLFNFNYTWLSIISFGVYILIGYCISPKCGFSVAALASLITGFYEATVGWKLSVWCKANTGMSDEDVERITPSTTLTVMLFVSPLFAFFGHLLA